MALYNQLAGGLAAMETLLGHLNKEEAARQQKVLDQARERFQELAEAEEKYISANIKSRAEALAAVEAMMRELDLTQSQYEAIRDALIAQNVISAAAGQAYAGTWEDLLYGDLAEYGVGYAPVLGNIYFAKEGGEAAAGENALAQGAAAAGSPNPEDPNGDDKKIKPGDKTPKGRKYTKHAAERANERGFDSQKIDSIIDNNYKHRVKEIDELTGEITWRYQDKRGNTVITDEWGDKIITVYSHPVSVNGGNYIPKK